MHVYNLQNTCEKHDEVIKNPDFTELVAANLSAFNDGALLTDTGANLARFRSRVEVFGGFLFSQSLHCAFNAYLFKRHKIMYISR